jgi:hypothetical protein
MTDVFHPSNPLQKMLDMVRAARLLKMRTCLYVNDVMLFMRPTSSDVANLPELLIHFREATGLHTNTHKSKVFPIRCEGIDISRIVEQMQVKQGSCPVNTCDSFAARENPKGK